MPKSEQAHFSTYLLLFPVRYAHRTCGFAALPGSSLADVYQSICSKLGLRDSQAGLHEPNFDNPTAPEMAAEGRQYREAVSRIKKNADRACSFQRFFCCGVFQERAWRPSAKLAETTMPVASSRIAGKFSLQLSFLKESAYPSLAYLSLADVYFLETVPVAISWVPLLLMVLPRASTVTVPPDTVISCSAWMASSPAVTVTVPESRATS